MRLGASSGALVAVAVGGMAGGVLRIVSLTASSALSWLALLGINALGSCLIGVVLAFSEPGRRRRIPPVLSLGLMAGFCGAFTTFSTFSLMTLQMAAPIAGLHLAVSLVSWLAAAALGLLVGRKLNPVMAANRKSR